MLQNIKYLKLILNKKNWNLFSKYLQHIFEFHVTLRVKHFLLSLKDESQIYFILHIILSSFTFVSDDHPWLSIRVSFPFQSWSINLNSEFQKNKKINKRTFLKGYENVADFYSFRFRFYLFCVYKDSFVLDFAWSLKFVSELEENKQIYIIIHIILHISYKTYNRASIRRNQQTKKKLSINFIAREAILFTKFNAVFALNFFIIFFNVNFSFRYSPLQCISYYYFVFSLITQFEIISLTF